MSDRSELSAYLFSCCACGTLFGKQTSEWLPGVTNTHKTKVKELLMQNAGNPQNPRPLLVNNSHIWHNCAYGPNRTGRNFLQAQKINTHGTWRFKTNCQLTIDDLDTTTMMCVGCNNVAEKEIEKHLGLVANVIKSAEQGGQRIIMTLVAQVACILEQMDRPGSKFWTRKFNAHALLSFYTSLTMYLWHVSEGDLNVGRFLQFHQFCFHELPLHDIRGLGLKDALLLQSDVDDPDPKKFTVQCVWHQMPPGERRDALQDEYSKLQVPSKDEIQQWFIRDDQNQPKALAPHALTCKYVLHNINRLYFEQYHNINIFCRHSAVPRGVKPWVFTQHEDLEARCSSLGRLFNEISRDAWSLLLLKFITTARESSTYESDSPELTFLRSIASLAVDSYEALAERRRRRLAKYMRMGETEPAAEEEQAGAEEEQSDNSSDDNSGDKNSEHSSVT